ncbi:MAG: O-acetyl-ADP-ribose deacetylase [Actinomycetes bacterium]|jgi:O-acetyl-ADP-ribose deacetylase (regulator of RNase III)|nr:MAG: O-acetyl-ADP-ribose deacetylase [Actinomycetota bacterium]
MTLLETVQGDITTIPVDAIVNAANSRLAGGGGVDGAIHAAGGPSILEECRRIVAARGHLPTGQAVATGAGRLPARFVIHTVGPIWGRHPEDDAVELLASCYRSSLDEARDRDCRTVSFPAISTGVYGFPKDLACRTAVAAVREWVAEHPDALDRVLFVCFSAGDHERYLEELAR